MKWKKFTLTTTTEAVDLVSSMFDDIGIEGIEIEDNIPLTEKETKGMFIDILPELPPDEGVAKVSFYLDDDADVEEMLRKVNEGLDELELFTDLGARSIAASETEDKDWINNWKQYFKPFTVDNILIKPTWETIPEEHKDKLLVQIDPGTAFGTGMHETTQLCIRQLEKHVHSEAKILDVGTGSGILGITALKLGAKEVWGTDLDENAITAVGENLEANGISNECFHVLQGNIIDDPAVKDWAGYGKYDIAVANILADVIILLVNEIPAHLKKGGYFITSGIINMKDLILLEDRTHFSIRDYLRQPLFTFESKKLSELMIEMRKTSNNIVIVSNEYGATAGLITLEDILEEIVGDIRDEFDEDEEDELKELSDGEYMADGSMNLDDFNDRLGLDLQSEDFDSVGGFMIDRLEHLPKEGEEVNTDKVRLVVEKVNKNRISKVHIYVKKPLAN